MTQNVFYNERRVVDEEIVLAVNAGGNLRLPNGHVRIYFRDDKLRCVQEFGRELFGKGEIDGSDGDTSCMTRGNERLEAFRELAIQHVRKATAEFILEEIARRSGPLDMPATVPRHEFDATERKVDEIEKEARATLEKLAEMVGNCKKLEIQIAERNADIAELRAANAALGAHIDARPPAAPMNDAQEAKVEKTKAEIAKAIGRGFDGAAKYVADKADAMRAGKRAAMAGELLKLADELREMGERAADAS